MRTRLGLADALQASGRVSTALIEYEKILLEYPYDVAALYGRGTVLMELGRPQDAETALLAVLAQDKGHVRAAEDLGDYYASLKQYRDVLEAVRPAVQVHPTEARLQYLTGLAYENLGHRDLALARYGLALRRRARHARGAPGCPAPAGRSLSQYLTAQDDSGSTLAC